MKGPLRPTSEAMRHRQFLTRSLLFSCGAVLVAACELAEVEIPLGDPVVVVHGVMRPDLPLGSYGSQFIILERSFTGTVDHPYTVGSVIPTEGSPKIPLDSATVQMRNLDYTADGCADTTTFSEVPGDFRLPDLPGVYWSPPLCPGMRAGDRLELTVLTHDGQRITGVTRVPGMTGAHYIVAGDSLPFGTDSVKTVNRDRDTVRIHVDAVAGRLLQIDMFRLGDLDMFLAPDRIPTAKLLVDTVSVTLPGNLTDVFAQGEGDDLMRAGRDYLMTVSLTDSNYYDFTRSSNNKFTGRGFINHLTGGVGVFGSLVATSTRLHVVGDFDDPRDGVYRLQGTVQGVDVDATVTVYAYRSTDSTELSAFLDGDWIQERYAVWEPWQVENKSIDGYWDEDRLMMVIYQKRIEFKSSMMRVVVRGIRTPGRSFDVGVADSLAFDSFTLGTLTATQERAGASTAAPQSERSRGRQ